MTPENTPKDIYQDEIVTLAKSKTGATRLENPDATVTLDNPLCGDRVTLDVTVADGKITSVGHRVRGCMLCEASAALVARDAIGTDTDAVHTGREKLAALLKNGPSSDSSEAWSTVSTFGPVAEFKSRHECVLLPFEALDKAVKEATGNT
jgi:nitrogen fixation protein NifU and related proteins